MADRLVAVRFSSFHRLDQLEQSGTDEESLEKLLASGWRIVAIHRYETLQRGDGSQFAALVHLTSTPEK